MNKVRFADVVKRVNINVDRHNTERLYYVGGEHIDSDEFMVTKRGLIKGSTIGFKFHFGFNPGHILFGSRNPHLRKCSMVDFEGICSDSTYVVETKDPNILLQEYLLVEMQSDRFWAWAEANKSGGVNYLINYSTLNTYEFPLPPIEEQKRLSEKLWAAYEVKQSYLNMIAATDEMVKSQFIEMFKDTKRERLGDFCTTHARIGWQKLTRAEFLDMGDYYLITGWDIMDDHTVDFSKCKYVSKERYEQDPKLIMREDDVLLTKDGTLGKVAIVRGLDKPATLNGHIFVIRSKDGRIIPEFLIGLFTSNEFICQLNDNKVGSTIAGITQKSLLEFQIPVATIEEQLDFVSIMKQADKSKFELRKSIESIDKVIKSLINENL